MTVTAQKVVVGTIGTRIDILRKAELMEKWVNGSASSEERRDLFIHLLIKRLDSAYFLTRHWFLDHFNCLCTCDRDGNLTRVVTFDEDHRPRLIHAIDPNKRNEVVSLQSCFEHPGQVSAVA